MENKLKYIIIPDVHGRTFWKDTINKYKDHKDIKIIFLGDYLDPYTSFEGINETTALDVFKEIIDIAKNDNRIILLLGNHDYHYINRIDTCRMNINDYDEIHNLFIDNISLFKVAYDDIINNKKYLFTHAGVTNGWINTIKQNAQLVIKRLNKDNDKNNIEILNNILNISLNADSINYLLSDINNRVLTLPLEMISYYRGGYDKYGSCIWADIHEHFNNTDEAGDVYQIFGHTFSYPDLDLPDITNTYAMLDCRKVFGLYDNNDIKILE